MHLASWSPPFYPVGRLVTESAALTQARLWLASGTKQVLANLLGLVGVSAPESMDKLPGSTPDGSSPDG
jgi:arginyl-tRNA synthetase